ncbi:hypothetical protein D3C71_2154190 [compost metagenome]
MLTSPVTYMIGLSIGSVIRVNLCHAEAPSICAASIISWEMPVSPDSIISVI